MPAKMAVPAAAPLPNTALVMRQVSTMVMAKSASDSSPFAWSAAGTKSLTRAEGSISQATMADAQLLATT